MMRKIVIASAIAVQVTSANAAKFTEDPYIDKEQLKSEEELKQRKIDACGNDVRALIGKCGNQVAEQWRAEGNDRGTSEYCDVHYAPADSSFLKQKYFSLKKINARSNPIRPKPGEVSREDLEYEIWCITEILDERGDLE